MRIKFVTIKAMIMNKRNTIKDFGGNSEGIFAKKEHLKRRLTFENTRGHPIQKIYGSNCICPKKLRDIHLEH
jgi:hypothetical protein